MYMTLGALEAAFRGLVLNLLMDLFFNISRFSTSSCYSCNVCLCLFTSTQLVQQFLIQHFKCSHLQQPMIFEMTHECTVVESDCKD